MYKCRKVVLSLRLWSIVDDSFRFTRGLTYWIKPHITSNNIFIGSALGEKYPIKMLMNKVADVDYKSQTWEDDARGSVIKMTVIS